MKTTDFINSYTQEGVDPGEYNDESGMIKNDLHTIVRVATELNKHLGQNENLPTWVIEKIAQTKGMIVSVVDYMISQHELGQKDALPGFDAGQAEQVFESALAETTGDKPFDNMIKNISKGTKKQATADRREQKAQNKERARAAFGNMFGGNPADKLKIKEQGVAEGEGNFEKALNTLSGSWSGWHKDESSDPNIESYWFDDGEGGYYAGGTIEHDLQTGKVTVDYSGDEYHGPDVKGTFDNFGDAMRALRGGGGNHGGKAPKHDTLASKTLAGPDDLYKTDRAGKKGTLTKARMDGMKASSQYTMRGGPKGVLPEQGMAEGELDEATGDKKFDSMLSRMTAEPKYPDKDMPPTSIAELIQWADRNNKPYHEYFAQWARRNGFKNVNDALVWFGDNVDPNDPCPWGPKDFLDPWGRPAAEELQDAAKHDPKAAELMKVFRCYEEIVFDWPDEYRQMNMPEGVAEGNLKEDASAGASGASSFAVTMETLGGTGGFTKADLAKQFKGYSNMKTRGGPVKVKNNG